METPFPPFDPDGDELNEEEAGTSSLRLRDIPLRVIFPNLLTLLAICSGLTAIRFAIDQRIELAVGAILFAGFLDGIDGRVARFLKSTSRFGAQMDSLADFVNFGVAPAMLVYFSVLIEFNSPGWIVTLVYASCACLRLARFNAMLDNDNAPNWQTNYFVGVPAPAGATIVLLPIYIWLWGIVELGNGFVMGVMVYTLCCGFLMVSNLPTFSGKNISRKLRRDIVLPFLIFTVFLFAAVISYPWQVLSVIVVIYLCSLPFSHRSWNRRMRMTDSEVDKQG